MIDELLLRVQIGPKAFDGLVPRCELVVYAVGMAGHVRAAQ